MDGRPVPLGYQVDNRKLIINEQEANLVIHIMQRYLELGSVSQLADEINKQGHRTKVQRRTSGPHRGGCLFRRGTLYHLLANRIYLGELVHKGIWFEAEHPAIVPQHLWDAVQQKLAARASGSSRPLNAKQPALLLGLTTDGEGRAMTSSHATKAGKRYRYYVTRPNLIDGSPAWRVNGHDLERLILERPVAMLSDRQQLCDLAGDRPADVIAQMFGRADYMILRFANRQASDKAMALASIVDSIQLHEERIELCINPAKTATALGWKVCPAICFC